MNAHSHCKAISCYNRIQFIDTCSRCDGPTTPCRGPRDGCGGRPQPAPGFQVPTSVDEADRLLEELKP